MTEPKSERCPYCGGELKLSYTDDAGTDWCACYDCMRLTPIAKRKAPKEKSPILLAPAASALPKILDHLNSIEDPRLANQLVEVPAVVSSTSIPYVAPSELKVIVKETEQEPSEIYPTIPPDSPINAELVGVSSEVKYKRLERKYKPAFGGRVLNIEEKKWRTIYLVRVKPPVFTLEKLGEKIVDEKGFEYKTFDVYVTADEKIDFQPSSLITLQGKALPNPKTQRTTFLAHSVEFPETIKNFDAQQLECLKTKFSGKSVNERLSWILENFEKYSQVIGRRNLTQAIFLSFFTPIWVKFNGETERGWGNVGICGDTTAGKSKSVRKAISLLKAGTLITAETASTVGLTGTATQIEREGWFIDWGFLVLSDRKLLAVDGAQKLSLSNWAALAEAERTGVLCIVKAAKNSAYARTRQIKIANAVDREADKYSTKSLATFLYPCQALATIFDKTSIARLDIAVFADQRDVSPEIINSTTIGEPDKDLQALSEVLKWCWSDTATVEFTQPATERLLAKATELHKLFFCEMIPLASIDLKWKLARLSVALAYLTLSTNDFKTVTVTEEHVQGIADFMRQEYINAGLNIIAQKTRFEKIEVEDVKTLFLKMESASKLEPDKVASILQHIVTHGRITKDELKAQFCLSDHAEMRPLLAVLQAEGLVKVGRGFYPEPKLIEAYKVTGGFTLH